MDSTNTHQLPEDISQLVAQVAVALIEHGLAGAHGVLAIDSGPHEGTEMRFGFAISDGMPCGCKECRERRGDDQYDEML